MPATWAHGTMRYGHRTNPRRLTRRKARAILHHGEVGGHRLTRRQRGLFGAVASGYRLRKYRNPPYSAMWAGRPNPFGIGAGTLALLGGAALLLFTRQGKALIAGLHLGGAPGVPAGYVTVGPNLYRGPDGRLYARNPNTGAMVQAPPNAAVPTSGADLLAKAGIALIPQAGVAVSGWLRDLFTSQHTATTAVGDAGTVATGVNTDPGVSPFPALPPMATGPAWVDTNPITGQPYDPLAAATLPDYTMPVAAAIPDLPPVEPSTFYPQVDYATTVGDPTAGGFFGLDGLEGLGAVITSLIRGPHPDLQRFYMPHVGVHPPLPWLSEWRSSGPQYLRRPASRL